MQPLADQPYPQTISLNISYPPPVNKELTHHKPEQPLKAPTPLSRNDKLLAKKAQHYFERNRRDSTALWDSVQGYPHTTLWDIGSGIAGTLALEALAMKTTEQTHFELQKLLITLQALPIYNQTLPNREYNTKTGKPSGKLSDTDSNGNGWSALDIGRLLIWLRILQEIHPEFAPDITALLTLWQLDRAIHKGTLYGMKQTHRGQHYRQEGRNGYLQYAVEGFRLFGFDVPLPNLNRHLEIKNIQGYPIRTDRRNVPFLTSDPFILASLEYGLDRKWNQIETIYQLHRDHSAQSHQLFSFAEDAMDKNPWFAYNNLYYYGKPWTSVSPSGKIIENPQVFSNKAAFGFSVLFEDDFSDELYNEVLKQSLLFRSIPTGIYADGGSNGALNINTNSLILVALWFKQRGGVPICLNCQPIPLH
nr:DUF3131 domain-containing protein [Vibrio agarilyticus]